VITGEQLLDATQDIVDTVAAVGLEQFLRDRDVDENALRALVRAHGNDIVEGAADVSDAIVQSVILGYLAGQATAVLKAAA
jgi:hypothetical protein